MSQSQTAPTASGTLAAIPLGHLLVYALDRRLTGSVVFEEPDHKKHAVYFAYGAPAAARGAAVVAPLGELAVEQGALTVARLETLLGEARETGLRLGEVLVARDVLDAEALDALLRVQVARRVKGLATLPLDTAYGYYEGVNFLERAGGPSRACPPLPLILRVLQKTADPHKAADALARLGGAVLRFHAEAPLAHFELEPGEQAVVDVLRAKPQALAELTARGLLESGSLERLLYTLLLLRHFDLGSGTQPIGAERRSVTPAAPTRTVPPAPVAPTTAPESVSPGVPAARSVSPAPAPAVRLDSPSPAPTTSTPATPAPGSGGGPASGDSALRREAEERLSADEQTHYQVLGVAPDAAPSAIASAYFQLAKRWHPDRVSTEGADLREAAMRIFARVSEASQVLSDPDKRRDYDTSLENPDASAEEQRQVQRLLRAATNFQKATVLLRRNNLPAAEEAARAALEDAPEEADHIALVAWLAAMKPGADLVRELRQVDRASKLEPENTRARWYRGQLLKRLGKERAALEDFRFIVEKDPRHVDAQREIRLYELSRGQRKSSSDSPPGGRLTDPGAPRTPAPASGDKAGFFGKLFKK